MKCCWVGSHGPWILQRAFRRWDSEEKKVSMAEIVSLPHLHYERYLCQLIVLWWTTSLSNCSQHLEDQDGKVSVVHDAGWVLAYLSCTGLCLDLSMQKLSGVFYWDICLSVNISLSMLFTSMLGAERSGKKWKSCSFKPTSLMCSIKFHDNPGLHTSELSTAWDVSAGKASSWLKWKGHSVKLCCLR